MNPIDKLKFEDLPEFSIFRDIWVSMGGDAFKKLISEFAGLNIYIPKASYFDKFIVRVIQEEKLTDDRDISKMFNISRRTARNHLNNAKVQIATNKIDKEIIKAFKS